MSSLKGFKLRNRIQEVGEEFKLNFGLVDFVSEQCHVTAMFVLSEPQRPPQTLALSSLRIAFSYSAKTTDQLISTSHPNRISNLRPQFVSQQKRFEQNELTSHVEWPRILPANLTRLKQPRLTLRKVNHLACQYQTSVTMK